MLREWMSLCNDMKTLGNINGKATNGEGKLTNKTAWAGWQKENVREREIPKERWCKSERSKYHSKTRSAKSSNQDITGGWGKRRFCGLVIRETRLHPGKEWMGGEQGARRTNIFQYGWLLREGERVSRTPTWYCRYLKNWNKYSAITLQMISLTCLI